MDRYFRRGLRVNWFRTILAVLVATTMLPAMAAGQTDRLVIKNDGGTDTFKVRSNGYVYSGGRIGVNDENPFSELTVVGTTFPVSNVKRTVPFVDETRGIAVFELVSTGDMVDTFGPTFGFRISDDTYNANSNIVAMQAGRDGSDRSGEFVILTAEDGILRKQFTVKSTGNVGVGTTAPQYRFHVQGQAYFSEPIIEESRRASKENIVGLNTQEAFDALEYLSPVKFNYKADSLKEEHVGFIAEEVPELVATKDRAGLNSLNIVAVLTKVVKEQNETIRRLSEKVERLEKKLE